MKRKERKRSSPPHTTKHTYTHTAEEDLLSSSSGSPYILKDTGQGLHRVQQCPRTFHAMQVKHPSLPSSHPPSRPPSRLPSRFPPYTHPSLPPFLPPSLPPSLPPPGHPPQDATAGGVLGGQQCHPSGRSQRAERTYVHRQVHAGKEGGREGGREILIVTRIRAKNKRPILNTHSFLPPSFSHSLPPLGASHPCAYRPVSRAD